jgi:membrane-bound lytic murein transglycosylase A
MAAHPDEAANVRGTNRSYVFFRVTGLSNEGEPVGAQGVPLTPGRSIAVDRVHEYGTPFFIEANLPIESVKPASPFRRLMIAQERDRRSPDRRAPISTGVPAMMPAASPAAFAIPLGS